MTLTYFKARSTWVPMHLNGETVNMSFEGKLANGQNIDYSENKWPKGFICPCTVAKYHNIQTCLMVYVADFRGAFTGPLVLWSKESLRRGKSCVRFRARSDQNSGFHGNR